MMNEGKYSRLGFGQLCDVLLKPEKTLIVFHDRPDGDAAGSAFALKLLLGSIGTEAECMCSCPVGKRYSFAFEGLCRGVLPEDLPTDFVPGRIISVDTASLSQIEGLANVLPRDVDIMIDHHGSGRPFADNYIDPSAAACGEIIYDIAKEFISRGYIKALPRGFALLVYMAVATDTGCFRYSNTTPMTHMRVAELMDGSFDYAQVNYRLFDSKTPSEFKIMKKAAENLKLYCGGRLSVVAVDYDEYRELGVDAEYYDGLIETARSVEGAQIAVSIRRTVPEREYRVSMRSNGKADVSEICAAFGGGGHAKAAGCSLENMTLGEAVDAVVFAAGKILE